MASNETTKPRQTRFSKATTKTKLLSKYSFKFYLEELSNDLNEGLERSASPSLFFCYEYYLHDPLASTKSSNLFNRCISEILAFIDLFDTLTFSRDALDLSESFSIILIIIGAAPLL
ncbi:MAG: hypothetical protein COA61_000950 [Zetaproteobacteria bacterium]|nr:hypothetical protein [Zetaproteobacteria bacterium]